MRLLYLIIIIFIHSFVGSTFTIGPPLK